MPSHSQLLLGEIVTMDPAQPRAEAIGIVAGKIAAVGSEADVRAILGAVNETRKIKGTLVPGLIDTHNHMHWTGMQSRLVDLSQSRSIADIQSAIRAYAQAYPDETWISSGSGWHVVNLQEQRYPTRQEPADSR
jgi:predicted amidohydrolase YtcJ